MEIATFRHWNSETDQVQYEIPAELIRRPQQFNTSGKAITIGINSYPITQFPKATVYQYDVSQAARTALPLPHLCTNVCVLITTVGSHWKRGREAWPHQCCLGLQGGSASSWDWLDL